VNIPTFLVTCCSSPRPSLATRESSGDIGSSSITGRERDKRFIICTCMCWADGYSAGLPDEGLSEEGLSEEGLSEEGCEVPGI